MKLEQIIDEQTLQWLLEKDNPSVRYFTMKQLLGKQEHEVTEARMEIMKSGVVPAILEKQSEEGFWGNRERFYSNKYAGTVWQLIILAGLGADPANEGIKKACEFILQYSQDTESHGFAVNGNPKNGGRHNEVIPCLTGNMLYSLQKLGYANDERVLKGIDWIVKYQRADDGIPNPPQGWPYDRFDICFGSHTCHMGVVKSLKALSAVPVEKRTTEIENKIKELCEYLLLHHIYKKSHDTAKVSKPGWLKLGFPLMYQTDMLEILEILTGLNCRDNRMDDAINLLKAKQNNDKRWILENTFNGKMIEDIEQIGESSKWITLKAATVLMKYAE